MSILRCEHQSRSRLIRSFESPPLQIRMVAAFPQKRLTFLEKYGDEGVSKSA
jgi:hypothetical protein